MGWTVWQNRLVISISNSVSVMEHEMPKVCIKEVRLDHHSGPFWPSFLLIYMNLKACDTAKSWFHEIWLEQSIHAWACSDDIFCISEKYLGLPTLPEIKISYPLFTLRHIYSDTNLCPEKLRYSFKLSATICPWAPHTFSVKLSHIDPQEHFILSLGLVGVIQRMNHFLINICVSKI